MKGRSASPRDGCEHIKKHGVVPKARLVARGFEETNTQDLPKDSPTYSSEALKMIMAVICQNKWQLNSMDIKAVFLQGKELTRDIYIHLPQEAQSKETIWKLKKCVYGLTDASLFRYNRVKDLAATWSYSVKGGSSSMVMGILASHVDDFIWGGTDAVSITIIRQLKAAFQVNGKSMTVSAILE